MISANIPSRQINYNPPDKPQFHLQQLDNGKWVIVNSWFGDYYFLNMRSAMYLCSHCNEMVYEIKELRSKLNNDNELKKVHMANRELKKENEELKSKLEKYENIFNKIKDVEL